MNINPNIHIYSPCTLPSLIGINIFLLIQLIRFLRGWIKELTPSAHQHKTNQARWKRRWRNYRNRCGRYNSRCARGRGAQHHLDDKRVTSTKGEPRRTTSAGIIKITAKTQRTASLPASTRETNRPDGISGIPIRTNHTMSPILRLGPA